MFAKYFLVMSFYNQILFHAPHWFFRIAPLLLLPFAVYINNFGWVPPEDRHVGNLGTWVIYAFLVGIAMWHQDRLNATFSTHPLFLPVIGIFNGFTVGLAVVLVLAGSITPDGALIVLIFVGGLWGLYVVSQKREASAGMPLDESALRSTLINLGLAAGAFFLTVSGIVSSSLGAALGFQFLTALPIYKSMDIPKREETVRNTLFFIGIFILIFVN
ncbi:hypothetical protein TA5114_00225 [Cognatishimia activa]|uniref:Uncharacterized protein n=2 Tax=Cognatishimia activa TaxID=1715691 RepID=A0A0P1ILR2_9RHOB|nr:hypothetical protein TA5113_00850 [Cognatishimia activa]CUK24442.1 hypothetical protein TA5114_00225 [Cognatishimia activa]